MVLWLMMMHHHTKFGRSEILSGQTLFGTFTVTLTLNTAKQPFHKTLLLMNIHCQTKLIAPKNHYRYVHYFVRLREGRPPKHYYPPPPTGNEKMEEYITEKRRRRIVLTL